MPSPLFPFYEPWSPATLGGNIVQIRNAAPGIIPIVGTDAADISTVGTSLSVSSGYYISGQGGDDSLTVGTPASTVAKTLITDGAWVAFGAGNDEFVFRATSTEASGYFLSMYDGANLTFGKGDDRLNIQVQTGDGLYLGSGSNINMGNGKDRVEVSANSAVYIYNGSSINFENGSDFFYAQSNNDEDGLYISVGSSVDMGNGADSIVAAGDSGFYISYGSSVTLGKGADRFSATGTQGAYVYNGSTVNFGSQSDRFDVSGQAESGLFISYGSSVNMGSGDDFVNAQSADDYGTYIENGALIFGSGEDSFDTQSNASSGLYLTTGGTVSMGSGNDLVQAYSKESEGIYVGSAYLGLGEGNDQLITKSQNGYAFSGYYGTTELGDGNDIFSAISTNSSGMYLSGFVISADDGDDTLDSKNVKGNGIGLYSYLGSTIDMGDGNNKVTATSKDREGLYLSSGSSLLFGSGHDELVAKSTDDETTYEAAHLEDSSIVMGNGKDSALFDSGVADVDKSGNRGLHMVSSSIDTGASADTMEIYGWTNSLEMTQSLLTMSSGSDSLYIESRQWVWDEVPQDYEAGTAIKLYSGLIDMGAGKDELEVVGIIEGPGIIDGAINMGEGDDLFKTAGIVETNDIIVAGGEGFDTCFLEDGEFEVTWDGGFLGLTNLDKDPGADNKILQLIGFEKINDQVIEDATGGFGVNNFFQDGNTFTVTGGVIV